jgi:hypothetical protein
MKNPLLEKIKNAYADETIYKADGLDEAIIGIDEDTMRLIYSCKKAVNILTKQMTVTKADLDEDEIAEGKTLSEKKREMAQEHFEFNVKGSKGDKLPIWCEDDFI